MDIKEKFGKNAILRGMDLNEPDGTEPSDRSIRWNIEMYEPKTEQTIYAICCFKGYQKR